MWAMTLAMEATGLSLSLLRFLPAGTHKFYLLGRRWSGPGTLLVYDSTLTVLAPGHSRVFLPMVLREH